MLFLMFLLLSFRALSCKTVFDSGETKNYEMNAIIFLAQNKPNILYDNDEGVKYLEMKRLATVSPCGSSIEDSNEETCNCEETLKSGLMSLIQYTRNVKRMATAVASSVNETVRNNFVNTKIKKSNHFHPHYNHHHYQHKSNSQLENVQDINILKNFDDNSFLDDTKMNSLKHPVSAAEQRRLQILNRKFWIQPEDTQIFEIKTKNSKVEQPREIREIPALHRDEKPRSFLDDLSLKSIIKKSFFDVFLNEVNNREETDNEEKGLNLKLLGRRREPTYFDLVKRTLNTVQKESENGFFMNIIGGDLQDISDPYSNLVQSIKHIDENTDHKNTLLVLTGMCPQKQSSEDEVTKKYIPVFAKGPHSSIFSEAQNLQDVTRLVKRAIQTMKGVFKKRSKSYGRTKKSNDVNDGPDSDLDYKIIENKISTEGDFKLEPGRGVIDILRSEANEFKRHKYVQESERLKQLYLKGNKPRKTNRANEQISKTPLIFLLLLLMQTI